MSHLLSAAQKTFRWDLLRCHAQGYIETCFQVFTLIVAIKVFQAPDTIKPFLPGAYSVGLLLTPSTLFLASRLHPNIGNLCLLYTLLAAFSIFLATWSEHLYLYILFVCLGQIFMAQILPLVTQIYSSNYKPRERGKFVSRTFIVAALTGGVASWFIGDLLDKNLQFHKEVLGLCTLAILVSGFSLKQMPSGELKEKRGRNPWQNINLVREDKVFGLMLGAWMLMGFCNLMTMPLRVEYLINERYGVDATILQSSVILVVIPLTMRLLSTPLWGYLFDRLNLIDLRVLLNGLFILPIAFFFTTTNLWIMAIASAIFGIASGGGQIMWTLWVTKIAPQDRIADYMSVHSAFTGFRGSIAPFVGYFLISMGSPTITAVVACSLGLISMAIFFRMRGVLETYRQRENQVG